MERTHPSKILQYRSEYTPLSREHEQELFRRYQENGDTGAGWDIVLSNMRLLFRFANKYRDDRIRRDDLIQEGALGAYDALQSYDPERGFRFNTLANFNIRSKMQQHASFILRWKRYARANTRRLDSPIETAYGEHEPLRSLSHWIQPDPHFSVLIHVYRPPHRVAFRQSNIELEHIPNYDGHSSLDDAIDARTSCPQFYHEIRETARRILSAREYSILEKRFFMEPQKMFEEIGKEEGVTRHAIWQAQEKAFKKLRRPLEKIIRKFGYEDKFLPNKKAKKENK